VSTRDRARKKQHWHGRDRGARASGLIFLPSFLAYSELALSKPFFSAQSINYLRRCAAMAKKRVSQATVMPVLEKGIWIMRISCRPSLAVLVTTRWQHEHLARSLTGDTNQNGNMYEEVPACASKARCKGDRLKHSTLATNLPIPYLATDH
jgi:hypothetical protein